VNCCCDLDCSSKDRKAFSRCSEQRPRQYDPNYCFNQLFLFSNRTQYVVEEDVGGLLCIVTDNMEDRQLLLERDAVENAIEFRLLAAMHEKSEWKVNLAGSPSANLKNYMAGSSIWITFSSSPSSSSSSSTPSSSLGFLHLPSKYNSGFCDTSQPVRYMEDHTSSCLVPLERSTCELLPILDANTYFKGFQVVASPSFFDPSSNDSSEGLDASLVPVQPYICQDDECSSTLEVSEVTKPNAKCENVVSMVTYDIHHQGVEGIQSVKVFLRLEDQVENQHFLLQTVAYRHFWVSDNDTAEPLSGAPGYQTLRPVRVATFDGTTSTMIPLTEGLTLLAAGAGGECQLGEGAMPSLPILFGEDMRTGCSVHLNRSTLSNQCQLLKKTSFRLLSGLNVTDAESTPRYVATFGDSLLEQPGDWVKVLQANIPDYLETSATVQAGVCSGLVTSLHTEIIFSNLGSVASPQAKIIGVMQRWGQEQDTRFLCTGLACNHRSKTQRIDFSTSVSFVDVTERADTRFKEYPVIEARFPNDFFYPFVAASGTRTDSHLSLVVVFVFLNLFQAYT